MLVSSLLTSVNYAKIPEFSYDLWSKILSYIPEESTLWAFSSSISTEPPSFFYSLVLQIIRHTEKITPSYELTPNGLVKINFPSGRRMIAKTFLYNDTCQMVGYTIYRKETINGLFFVHLCKEEEMGLRFAHAIISENSSVLTINTHLFSHPFRQTVWSNGLLYIQNGFKFHLLNVFGHIKTVIIYPNEVPLPLTTFVVSNDMIWFTREGFLWKINIKTKDYQQCDLHNDSWEDAGKLLIERGLVFTFHNRRSSATIGLFVTQISNLSIIFHDENFGAKAVQEQMRIIQSIQPIKTRCIFM